MSQDVLRIIKGTKTISNGPADVKTIMDKVDFNVKEGDFVTILGGNGAGKSTLFNSIAGTLSLTSGQILLKDKDITTKKEEERARYIARVFQDPKMGTAPRMTVSENLLLALYRGKKRGFSRRPIAQHREDFYELCQLIGNGLETHLDTPTGNLSGGQRQALSLLMATMTKPDLLLLDEHTAALDPKTSRALMTLTSQRITEQQITCLMITHRMDDALKFGNRLIVLEKGRIKVDLAAEEKSKLKMSDLLMFFEEEE